MENDQLTDEEKVARWKQSLWPLMQTKRQRRPPEQLHEQGKARAAQLQRDAEAFLQRVAAAADKTTNPLHQLDLDALRERVVNHRLGTNANGWKNLPESNGRASFSSMALNTGTMPHASRP